LYLKGERRFISRFCSAWHDREVIALTAIHREVFYTVSSIYPLVRFVKNFNGGPVHNIKTYVDTVMGSGLAYREPIYVA